MVPKTLATLATLATVMSGALPGQLRLIPRPREMTETGASNLTRGVRVIDPPESADRFAARDLASALQERSVVLTPPGAIPSARIQLLRAGSAAGTSFLTSHRIALDSAMRDEGYVLVAEGNTPAQVTVVGSTAAGVFYGTQTLKQLFDGARGKAVLHLARIRDWPAMKYRGVHDDLSRGPVPTLDFQKQQIRTFAAFKINVYSPYFEQALEYRSDPLVAPPGGAMTRDDIRALVAFARDYHIDVVPEQEAFGHLHHLLEYELYSPLGETPHGHVLAPDQPGSMALIQRMFAEIDSLFPSRFVHLGADETFELGRGQTMERVRREGLGTVYIDFLKRIEQTLRPSGKRFLFWGDIAQHSPELVSTLPKDMVAVAWEYGVAQSYDRFLAPFVQAGMETWVAPGVSNWSRVYPNYATALPNIQGFIRDGQRSRSTGALTTTWDDDGEALFNQTWYGVLFGAAAAWQPGESSIPDFQSAYGRAFHGDDSGKVDEAQRKLVAVQQLLQGTGVGDASDYLFWVDPYSADGRRLSPRIRPALSGLRVLAESALVLVEQARAAGANRTDALDALALGARKIDFIGMKFQFADEITSMYLRARDTTQRSEAARLLGDITGINGRLEDLRDGYALIRDLYEQAWRRENRPYWLQNVLARYDAAIRLWIDRIDRMNAARRLGSLPDPESLGFPERLP